MELLAVGYLVLIGAAAVLGVLVGAVGGAVVWRLRINLALGAALTACVCLLIFVVEGHGNLTWLGTKLIWGIPSMTVAFLVSSVCARRLESRTALSPIWTALAACGLGLVLGMLYLFLFRLSPGAPLLAAPAISAGMILVLIRSRRALPSAEDGNRESGAPH